MSIADGKVDIFVDVDTKDAKKELEEFIKEYSNKKHKIGISVGIDPQIHNKFKKIVQEFANSTVNINLGLDVSKAREQLNDFIKNCKFENIQFGVNFDKNSIQNNIKEASNFVDSAFKKSRPVKFDITFDEFVLKQQVQKQITFLKRNINDLYNSGVIDKLNGEVLKIYQQMYQYYAINKKIDYDVKQRSLEHREIENQSAKNKIYLENQKAQATVNSARIQNDAYSSIANSLSYVNRRIFNLLRNAFVFNVISRGFREVAKWTGILINKDQQLFNYLTLIKANLINAFKPIIQVILPWIRLLGEGILWLSQRIVDFINFFTGRNAKLVSNVKEAKSTVKDFEGLIKEDTKVSIPALPNSGFVEPITIPLKTYTPKKIQSNLLKPINLKSLALEKPRKNNILDNIKNNILKISNQAPKLSKTFTKLRRDLASFDKIEVLKLQKTPLDIIRKSFEDTYKSSKKLKESLPKIEVFNPNSKYSDFVNGLKDTLKLPNYRENDFIDGLKDTFKSPKLKKIKSIFDKDKNYGKMELPKIDFEVNPQSTLNAEKFKRWLTNNSGLLNILKSLLYSFFIAKWSPFGILGSIASGFIVNLLVEATGAMIDGAKRAKKILEEHPDWVGIHVNKKGHPDFGVLPGEKPEDYSTPHDTRLAEILAMEERNKQIKLGKEKEYLKERADLTKENVEELNKIHEGQRKKFVGALGIESSILRIFTNDNKKIFEDYFNSIKRSSDEATNELGKDKEKDTFKLSDELTKQSIFINTFLSNIESNSYASFKQVSKNLMNLVAAMVSSFSQMFENIRTKVSEIVGLDYFDKKNIKTTETGIEIKNWYTPEMIDFLEDLKKQKKYNIPHLAQGALLRGGDPFLAYLGDQPRGQTNIETPINTMIDAFKTALYEAGAPTNNINITAAGDMSQMIRFLNLKLNEENRRVGASMVSLTGE